MHITDYMIRRNVEDKNLIDEINYMLNGYQFKSGKNPTDIPEKFKIVFHRKFRDILFSSQEYQLYIKYIDGKFSIYNIPIQFQDKYTQDLKLIEIYE